MTAPNWYATEILLDERKHELERAARRAADRHLARSARHTRRFGRRH